MAVDSRNERASCIGLALPFGRIAPTADSVIGQQDRRQITYCYAGFISIPDVGTGLDYELTDQRFHFRLMSDLQYKMDAERMHFELPEEAAFHFEQEGRLHFDLEEEPLHFEEGE